MSVASRFLKGDKPKNDDCRRISRRTPQRMKYGYLWCDSLIYPRPCMIKDLSMGGARVQNMGDEIKLRMLENGFRIYFADEKQEVICKLAWAKGQMFGLKFQSGRMRPTRTYKPL
jgi:hypothetical protein